MKEIQFHYRYTEVYKAWLKNTEKYMVWNTDSILDLLWKTHTLHNRVQHPTCDSLLKKDLPGIPAQLNTNTISIASGHHLWTNPSVP